MHVIVSGRGSPSAPAARLPLGTALLGRAIDAAGSALDGGGALRGLAREPVIRSIAPAERRTIDVPLWTGVRSIDGLLTIGRGARVGILGAPGAGKSTLLAMLLAHARTDAIVFGLIGERGREAHEWMRNIHDRAALICATADRPAAERVAAAHAAAAQAQALASLGLHVLLVIDSLARYAYALREVSAASSEAVGRGGYAPSIFGRLAALTESAGNTRTGSVTLIATVLSDGDERDPVSEAARSLLDGHIELNSALAHAGQYPAIDVCASASRTMPAVASAAHASDAAALRSALALLGRTSDARDAGIEPADSAARRAVAAEPAIRDFLRQDDGPSPPAATLASLHALADRVR
ncbi:MAG TPA: ATP-binding cassette domain-containing protein [Candidatus Baltobacteraceae bacterium]|nr:ATP-binding cassette domain-containing protein [Candidatus Baltobacteraceae bacterium]